jgi:hypothetical protein
VAKVLSGTSTPPAMATAKAEIAHSGRLAMKSATRAPLTRPAPISARASARDSRSSSA